MSFPCILAPMAGITDLPFRLVARSFGCELAFAEMISARALVYQSKRTEKMLSSVPADRPLGVQLLGSDPEILRKALDKLAKYDFALIDFNAACPVNKVTERGEGASLLKDPGKLKELLKAIVGHSEAPVTVKIRAGWDEGSLNARSVALAAEEAGIKALFIHGRTREQRYMGTVNYRVIREVKEALGIPVIASGDTLSPPLIKRMFDETGCDGVTLARGALGNPWIFLETAEFLKSGLLRPRPNPGEIADTMVVHLDLCIHFYGERVGAMIFRKFFAWYTRGLAEMKPLRDRAFRAETRSEMREIIDELRAAPAEEK